MKREVFKYSTQTSSVFYFPNTVEGDLLTRKDIDLGESISLTLVRLFISIFYFKIEKSSSKIHFLSIVWCWLQRLALFGESKDMTPRRMG